MKELSFPKIFRIQIQWFTSFLKFRNVSKICSSLLVLYSFCVSYSRITSYNTDLFWKDTLLSLKRMVLINLLVLINFIWAQAESPFHRSQDRGGLNVSNPSQLSGSVLSLVRIRWPEEQSHSLMMWLFYHQRRVLACTL